MREKYLAFGYVIDSPIPLPEAFPVSSETKADVNVIFGVAGGDFPKSEDFNIAREERFWWFSVPDNSNTLFNCQSGLFEIHGGNEIIIQLYPDTDMEKAKIFLLGSAMGAIQVQRGRVPIHGGSVVTSRGAMIISGEQGAGKSTMTSAFVHNGYKYLTDDVSSISIEGDQAYVVPAFPQRKLVRDACAPLGYDPDGLIVVDSDRDKLAVRDRDNWQREKTILSAIVELYPEPEKTRISVETITGRQRLECVMQNLYRRWMHVPGGNFSVTELKKALVIASQAEVYRVGVPRGIDRIASIAQEIAAELEFEP